MSDDTLFDLDVGQAGEHEYAHRVNMEILDPTVEWVSCRFCQVLTTSAGLVRFEHGPESSTCATYLKRYGGVVGTA